MVRNGKKDIENYKTSLQQQLRVGCFTTVSPLMTKMWQDPNFGDLGRGICFEYSVDDENFRPDGLSFLPVLYDDSYYDSTEAMYAVIEYAEDKNNTIAAEKMVCLGYGHTLIKNIKYENEEEWRLVIPIRDDGAHLDYFNVDNSSKRDMTNAIQAVYFGYNIKSLDEYQKYIKRAFDKWNALKIPIYELRRVGEKIESTLFSIT